MENVENEKVVNEDENMGNDKEVSIEVEKQVEEKEEGNEDEEMVSGVELSSHIGKIMSSYPSYPALYKGGRDLCQTIAYVSDLGCKGDKVWELHAA